jgi:hypothetical protein
MEYIDKRVDTAVLEREKDVGRVTPAELSEIKDRSRRSVAGFRVADEEMEKKLLDEQIRSQRAALDKFIFDRRVMRETLDKAGISPLTILPRQAWDNICKQTHLFRLNPDKNGRVAIARGCWEGRVSGSFTKPISKWTEEAFEWAQTVPEVWRELLYKMWPYGMGNAHDPSAYMQSRPQEVTVLLPTPPDDVVETLLKADKAKIPMKVAAVAEAIGFKESLAGLKDGATKHYADEDARIKRLLEEPFIYSEHDSATAILAQFGEFPIEKAVVDAVVAAKDFIPETITTISPVVYDRNVLNTGMSQAQVGQLQAQSQLIQNAMAQYIPSQIMAQNYITSQWAGPR